MQLLHFRSGAFLAQTRQARIVRIRGLARGMQEVRGMQEFRVKGLRSLRFRVQRFKVWGLGV